MRCMEKLTLMIALIGLVLTAISLGFKIAKEIFTKKTKMTAPFATVRGHFLDL